MKKRKDGRYLKQITINGKAISFYSSAKTESKAIKDIERQLLNYRIKQENGKTFEEVAEEWRNEHFKTLAYNSIKSMAPALERAIEEFGGAYIKQITAKDVNSFIIKFAKKGFGFKSVTNQLQIVRQVLSFGMLEGYVDYNVAIAVKVPKNLPRTHRTTPEPQVIKIIKSNTSAPFALFSLFALYTGCRRGELLALQYKDIDFINKEINITKSVYYISNKPYIKKPKTEAGNRKVILLPELEKHIPKLNPDEYIFSHNGEMLTDKKFQLLWRKYCKDLSIDITPHQLRHYYATRLYELNIDEKSAQDLLGHADIQTTRNIYTHISDEKRKLTYRQLQGF